MPPQSHRNRKLNYADPVLGPVVAVGLIRDPRARFRDSSALPHRQTLLTEFLVWSKQKLSETDPGNVAGMVALTGVLTALSVVFKLGKRRELLPHGTRFARAVLLVRCARVLCGLLQGMLPLRRLDLHVYMLWASPGVSLSLPTSPRQPLLNNNFPMMPIDVVGRPFNATLTTQRLS